jgi:hypothetical protein
MKQNDTKTTKYTIKEQCPDVPPVEIKVNVLSEGGQIWIQPDGFGEKCSADGEGWPIGIEIWQGRLRLLVFDDVNREDPQIIDLEKAKESYRLDNTQGCNCRCTSTDYCKAAEYLADQGDKIFTGPMKGGLWNGRCMDACILSKKQNDKAAYEFLLKFGDQYVQSLSDSQKLLWQEIKDSAAAMLKPAKPCDATNKNNQ